MNNMMLIGQAGRYKRELEDMVKTRAGNEWNLTLRNSISVKKISQQKLNKDRFLVILVL